MTSPAELKPSGGRTKTIVLGAVGAAVLVAVVTTVAVHASSGHAAAAPKARQPVVAGSSAPTTTAAPPTTTVRPAAPAPLTVTAISPRSGSTDVSTGAALTVDYSMPLSATPPAPTLSPAVAGTWTRHGAAMTFQPTGGWLPFGTETVTVPAGAKATVGGVGTTSTRATTTSFTVQSGSQTRVEQMLAELNYLPLTFEPTTPLPAGVSSPLTYEGRSATTGSTSPLPGTLKWSWSSVPGTLSSLWQPGRANVMDQGAVMAFQSDHHMDMDGVAGPKVWAQLLSAVAARQMDSSPYDYLVASETLPEKLTVYRAGKVIYSTVANTGVPGATTQQGTFPVFERFASTTMTGTNVDGTKYVDHGIPWVAYFNGGDAVHGFVRGSYGFPQSNGCVELPVSNAAQVWKMDPYGTLVTVTA
jgi:hypothetical protein